MSDSRRRIGGLLLRSPGLHFREIQRRLGLANGALEHHLRTLLRSGTIESERDGQFVRFYPPPILHEERTYISILRHPRLREIITFLILRPESDYKTIAQELNLSPSTITWYLKRLEQVGVVTREKRKGSELTCFEISEPEKLAKILSAYRQSFLDKAVDSFLDTWENL
ncbi:MAG TPA: winged helix-turn-helix transcriptional regulator [Candidatus Bathyarchaeia archaeon]|nr:winged helix-turn-helix transcriptional regulator [Candidatus Bathyarchaeia archaeon]